MSFSSAAAAAAAASSSSSYIAASSSAAAAFAAAASSSSSSSRKRGIEVDQEEEEEEEEDGEGSENDLVTRQRLQFESTLDRDFPWVSDDAVREDAFAQYRRTAPSRRDFLLLGLLPTRGSALEVLRQKARQALLDYARVMHWSKGVDEPDGFSTRGVDEVLRGAMAKSATWADEEEEEDDEDFEPLAGGNSSSSSSNNSDYYNEDEDEEGEGDHLESAKNSRMQFGE